MNKNIMLLFIGILVATPTVFASDTKNQNLETKKQDDTKPSEPKKSVGTKMAESFKSGAKHTWEKGPLLPVRLLELLGFNKNKDMVLWKQLSIALSFWAGVVVAVKKVYDMQKEKKKKQNKKNDLQTIINKLA